jgi:hypothetical protein
MEGTVSTQATNLFLLEDLEDVSRTGELPDSDRDALRAVADWIKTFVARPHKDLGRAGPVCPFVPGALERRTLWLAPELVGSYQRQFLDAQPTDGGDALYKSFVLVFADLPVERANELFDAVLEQLAVPSYAEDGFVMGGFHEGSEGTAIYNASFHPFTSPVPFLLVRQAVVGDWKFFLDDENWLNLWARRYGEYGAHALAEELRHLHWRA